MLAAIWSRFVRKAVFERKNDFQLREGQWAEEERTGDRRTKRLFVARASLEAVARSPRSGMASREDIIDLTDRMRRHDVSRPPRARRVPQSVSPRDARNARAGNGRRPGNDTARSSLSRDLATDFARLREKRDPLCDVKYDVSIRVPDCMAPPPPSPPVLRRATLEMLATPKRVPEKEQRRAASAAAAAAAAVKAEHLRRWTSRRREEMRAWRAKKEAAARATAAEEAALTRERRRYAREVNAYVFDKARKEMDVWQWRRKEKFEHAERRAAATSFGRHSASSRDVRE